MKLEKAARQASYVLYRFHTEFTPDEVSIYNNLREALAEQAEQKPVAWVEVERGIPMFMNFTDDYKPNIGNGIAPLYAAPVRTKDLTDDEINELWLTHGQGQMMYIHEKFARAVIAADREKNRGTA